MARDEMQPHLRGEIAAEDVRDRLQAMASIFRAIETGQLLAALPECPVARANHTVALSLLALLEGELCALCENLTS